MAGQKVWAVGEEVLAADFNSFVQSQVVPQYASLAALNSGWGSAPDGALAVTTDTSSVYIRRAGAWSKLFESGMVVIAFTSGGGTLPHSLGRTPVTCVLTVAQNLAAFVAWNTLGGAGIGVRAFTSAGAAYAGNLNVAYWCA